MNASPLTLSVALAVAVAGAGSAGTAGVQASQRSTTPLSVHAAAPPSPNPARDTSALGLPSSQALTVRSSFTDRDGTTYVRYDRTYKGLRVLGGDLLVDLSAKGAITDVTWNARKNLGDPILTPKVPAPTALARGKAEALASPTTESGKATKVIWAGSGSPRLAYDVLTTGIKADQTPTRLHTIVDASTGAVITSYDDIRTGTGRSMYSGTVSIETVPSGGKYQLKDGRGNYTTDLLGGTSGLGSLFTDFDDVWGNGLASSRQTAGVDAQYGAEMTYAYYSSVLGRAGIWNNGQGARSRVHFGDGYVNAFWDGTQMTYGDGYGNTHPLTSIDVAAHEMSHGVTENTANLTYSGEAGGLNEATSDIFGTAVEWFANSPDDTPDYLIGEKIDINGNGTPLRYLDRPSRDGASLDCWSTTLKNRDPHYASGPLNHWYFLTSVGSGARTVNGVKYDSPTCNGSTVTGIGHQKAERIWYRTLATKLTSSSTYAAARDGAIASAKELYGTDSTECRTVAAAFSAIAVAPGAQSCAGGSTPPPTGNLLSNGDFEAGPTGWTATNGAITNSTSRPAHSGSWKAWLGGNGRRSSEYVRQTVAVPSSGTPTLSFWFRIDTSETTSSKAYDTMKVQVVHGSTSTLATYSNLTTTGGSYVRTSFDLSAYKGQTVTLTWLMSEDRSLQTSFVVDDVSLA